MRIFLTVTIFLCIYNQYQLKNPIAYESAEKWNPLESQIEKKIKTLEIAGCTVIQNIKKYNSLGLFLRFDPIQIIHSYHRTQMKEIEEDLILILKKIIHLYNSIPEIRPYLREFPIEIDQLDVWIHYGPDLREYYQDPYFSLVHLQSHGRGILLYKYKNRPTIYNIEKSPFAQITLPELEQLQEQIPSGVPRNKEKVDPIFIEELLEKNLHNYKHQLHYSILEKIRRTFRLNIATTKEFSSEIQTKNFSASFWAQNRKMDLKQAKSFAANFSRAYSQEIKKSRIIQKTAKKKGPEKSKQKEKNGLFGFRVTFWDEYLNRVEEPFIAQIEYQNGTISYFSANSEQQLYLVEKSEKTL